MPVKQPQTLKARQARAAARKVGSPAKKASPVPVELLRNSERSTYRRCRLKWHWSYVLRLSPQREAGALTFGTGVHYALELRYPPGRVRGPHPSQTFKRWYGENKRSFSQWDDEGNKFNALELGTAMLDMYVDKYKTDDIIEIIQPEMPLQVDLMDEHGNYVATVVCKADAVFRNRSTRRVGLFEHKTSKTYEPIVNINSQYGDSALLYWLCLDITLRFKNVLRSDEHPDHVLFNWLRKAMPDDRPRNNAGHALNKDGTISKRQPVPILWRYPLDFGPTEMADIHDRLRKEAREMQAVKRGELALLINPTRDCKWDCPFKDPCELKMMGGAWKDTLELEYGTWNPYSDHEISEEKTR